MERLKKDNLIKKEIFSISTINDKTGMLFIGDTPGKEYNTSCNITNTEELDDVYKESWVCEMSHVGIINQEQNKLNNISLFEELKNNKLVSFDSAYDYISAPISEKETIKNILNKANILCRESKNTNLKLSTDFRHRMREEEITIICKITKDELKNKKLALSFVLQDFAYCLPFESLFKQEKEGDEMEFLIKYIDDENAIWTFGYPFFKEFLMIFNMEDKHVGMKKMKKTTLPIIDFYDKYTIKEEETSTIFKAFGYITLILVILAILFFVYHAMRKNNIKGNKDFLGNENDPE